MNELRVPIDVRTLDKLIECGKTRYRRRVHGFNTLVVKDMHGAEIGVGRMDNRIGLLLSPGLVERLKVTGSESVTSGDRTYKLVITD